MPMHVNLAHDGITDRSRISEAFTLLAFVSLLADLIAPTLSLASDRR